MPEMWQWGRCQPFVGCQHAGANPIWDSAIANLTVWMQTADTHPELIHIIILHLSNWRKNITPEYQMPFMFTDHIDQQSKIGWSRFLEGWVSMEWQKCQQAFYERIRSRKSGLRWITALIKKLWGIAWGLWEHRNEVLHHQDNVVSSAFIRSLDRKITKTYNELAQCMLLDKDRHLLHLRLHRILAKDLQYKNVWLDNATLALQATRHRNWSRMEQEQCSVTRMRSNMRTWLPRGSHIRRNVPWIATTSTVSS